MTAATDRALRAGRLIVYGDFGDPYCRWASRRVDLLRAAGGEVEWRAVQSAPRLPVTGTRDPAHLAQLSRRSNELAGLLTDGEALPDARPGFVPNTEAAVAAYAEACGAGVGDDVRRLLFALYWGDGVDIGDPNALRTPLAPVILRGCSLSDPLRRFGYAVSPSRGPITTAAWRRIRAWRAEWRQLGGPELPVVRRTTGPALSGVAGLQFLAEEVRRLDASLSATLTPATVQPVEVPRTRLGWASWASQAGGRWGRDGWAPAAR